MSSDIIYIVRCDLCFQVIEKEQKHIKVQNNVISSGARFGYRETIPTQKDYHDFCYEEIKNLIEKVYHESYR